MGTNATEDSPTSGTPHDGPHPAQEPPGDRRPRARLWLAGAAFVAGLSAFAAGEMVHGLIPAKNVGIPTMGQIVVAPNADTANAAVTRNGALSFAVLGVCLGGLLGVAGGLARGSVTAAAVAGLVGAIVGSALAGATSLASDPVRPEDAPVARGIRRHPPDRHACLDLGTGRRGGRARLRHGPGGTAVCPSGRGGRIGRRHARSGCLRPAGGRVLPAREHRGANLGDLADPAPRAAPRCRRDRGGAEPVLASPWGQSGQAHRLSSGRRRGREPSVPLGPPLPLTP